MISKEAKKIAKQIDKERERREKKEEEHNKEAFFMHNYDTCPRCGGEVIFLWWKMFIEPRSSYYKCKKCKITREHRFYY